MTFLILKTTSFTGYTDDNNPYEVRGSTANVIKALEDIGENLIKWFLGNQMDLNTDKCHFLLNSQGLKPSDRKFIHKKLFMRKNVRYKF